MASKTQQLKNTDRLSNNSNDFGTPKAHKHKNHHSNSHSHKNQYQNANSHHQNMHHQQQQHQHHRLNNNNTNTDKKNKDSCQQTINSHSHENKLPVNLFYSAAQYNKMLITNGRSIKKKVNTNTQYDNFVSNLQFINEPIFQSCEQKRQELRQILKQKQKQQLLESNRKRGNSMTKDCVCCCCEEYCKLCSNQHSYKNNGSSTKKNSHEDVKVFNKLSQEQLQKTLQKINSKKLKNSRKNKKKIITSQANINQNNRQKIQKKLKAIQNQQKQASSSYLSHKSFNIDNLICKSLIQFQQQKRYNKIKQAQQKIKKKQWQNYITYVHEKNKAHLHRSKSEKSKSINKQRVRKMNKGLNYWNTIKDAVYQQIRKDTIQRAQRKSSKSPTKQSKSVDAKHSKYTPEQIQIMRQKHERQALLQIQKQMKQKQQKKNKILKHLLQLQKNRIQHIHNNPKKKFEPNQKMIEQAFKNIVQQPKKQQKNMRLSIKKGKV